MKSVRLGPWTEAAKETGPWTSDGGDYQVKQFGPWYVPYFKGESLKTPTGRLSRASRSWLQAAAWCEAHAGELAHAASMRVQEKA